jgi:hypothetical protein
MAAGGPLGFMLGATGIVGGLVMIWLRKRK